MFIYLQLISSWGMPMRLRVGIPPYCRLNGLVSNRAAIGIRKRIPIAAANVFDYTTRFLALDRLNKISSLRSLEQDF